HQLFGRLGVEQSRDHHVEVPLQESLHELSAGVDLDPNEGARVTLFQRGYRGRDEIRGGLDDGAHRGLAGASGLERRELLAREPDLRQRRTGMPYQNLAVPGGSDAARMTLEELDVEDLLDLPQQLGSGRLRQARGGGRSRQPALVIQMHQEGKLMGLDGETR